MAIRIVVDVMGADRPPSELVAGALAAAQRLPLHLTLAGRRRLIEPFLPADAPAEVLDCEQVIEPGDPPMRAVRRRASSIVRGVETLAAGKARAFVSAGNTGAVVVASLLILGRLAGTERPGICTAIPTLPGGEVLVIDTGATADPKPHHLVRFAEMGSLCARELLEIPEPKVGLLSIGAEPLKGDKVVRAAHQLLSSWPGFAGNVEPHELITARPVDVVVTGGFAGNLVIKALEGGVEAVWGGFFQGFTRSPRARLGGWLLSGQLRQLSQRLRYDRHNGAPLLGVQGLVMVAHGRSSPRAMEAAVERTFWAAQAGLVERLEAGLPKQ